jgi:hypothetical protein
MLPVTFLYNKKSAISAFLWSLGAVIMFTYYISIDRPILSDPISIMLAVGDCLVLCLIIYGYVKRLRPALRGEFALEINNRDLIFKPRNLSIPLEDILDIELRKSPVGERYYLYVKKMGVSDTKQDKELDLAWIVGKPDDIYKAVKHHFDKVMGHKR